MSLFDVRMGGNDESSEMASGVEARAQRKKNPAPQAVQETR
jgi:hypothetical protein